MAKVMADSNLIVLVSCGERKLQASAAAKDIYISDRFKAARLFAEAYGDRWFILSAKHHLLAPDDVVDPYDVNLSTFNEIDKKKWAQKVISQLKKVGGDSNHFTVIAGKPYWEHLSPHFDRQSAVVAYPFDDLAVDLELTLLNRVNANRARLKDQEQFYKLLRRLQTLPNQMTCFSNLLTGQVPQRGVYFFFDREENRRFAEKGQLRVVRVGTHGVSNGSKSSLWQRLRTHRGTDNGFGSHRSSIFRLHVGNAMLSSKGMRLNSWGIGENASQNVRHLEQWLEQAVSEYLGQLLVAYLPILDEASADSDRSYIEKNVIALLTSGGSLDLQSSKWLGNFSSAVAIKESGLWNINYVGDEYDPEFLNVFDELISRCEKGTVTETSLAPRNWRRDMQRGNIGQQDLFG